MKRESLKRRVLIVGEGRETEYNYFVGLRNEFEERLESTSTSVSVKRGRGGDARNIVQNAINEARKFRPDRRRGDRVFLLLDTEGPGRAPELPQAELVAEQHDIEVVYSCPAFEYWLLCHFDRISRSYLKDCASVIGKLNKKWIQVCKNVYNKADRDIFDRVSHLLGAACSQALAIDLHHLGTTNAARRTNPSTQVYELVAILIGARTDERCPLSGTWELVGNDHVTVELEKGAKMPDFRGASATWKY